MELSCENCGHFYKAYCGDRFDNKCEVCGNPAWFGDIYHEYSPIPCEICGKEICYSCSGIYHIPNSPDDKLWGICEECMKKEDYETM